MTPELQLELANAALGSEALADAFRLADWIGHGRELTARGVLRPAVAVQACQALGIPLATARLRSAMDVARLHQAWESAVVADLVEAGPSRASAAPEAAALAAAAAAYRDGDGTAPLDAELAAQVMLAWLRAVGFQFGFPDDICGRCVLTLIALSERDAPTELAEVVTDLLDEDDDEASPSGTYVCPDCGQLHEAIDLGLNLDDDDQDDDHVDHILSAVELLTSFGAAATGPGRSAGGTVVLTPLGRLFAGTALTSISPPPEETAAGLVDILDGYLPRLAVAASARWAAGRTPAGAARELLDVAAADDSVARVVALTLVRELGPAALPAWRELAKRPGFGAYARQYLVEQGERSALDDNDQAWLLVDKIARTVSEVPDALLADAFRVLAGNMPPDMLAVLRACGHPQADRVAAMLEPAVRPPARRAARTEGVGGKLYQLLITLRDVDGPAVWRRVVVPARITLGELHEVIQDAMGWEDGHLHAFAMGKVTYGVPDGDYILDDQDEDAVLLSDLLLRKAQKLTYTYDFGDDWEHVVKLEKALLPGSKDAVAVGEVPACLAGEGGCPPEDCGGPWGYANLKEAIADPDHGDHDDILDWLGLDDPAEFDPAQLDLAEVNGRLRG